jgi:hypothetical protein
MPIEANIPNNRQIDTSKQGIVFIDTKRKQDERYIRAYAYNKQAYSSLKYPLFRVEVKFLDHYFVKPKTTKQITKAFKKFVNFDVEIDALISIV